MAEAETAPSTCQDEASAEIKPVYFTSHITCLPVFTSMQRTLKLHCAHFLSPVCNCTLILTPGTVYFLLLAYFPGTYFTSILLLGLITGTNLTDKY